MLGFSTTEEFHFFIFALYKVFENHTKSLNAVKMKGLNKVSRTFFLKSVKNRQNEVA